MTAIAANLPDRQLFLRRVLYADACTCIAMGAILMVNMSRLAEPLGLPAMLVQWAGIVLLPIGSLILLIASRRSIPTPGYAFIIGQAIAVAVLAELEYFGLGKSS